jgi:predicted HicB family RNase H-like nuclease
MLKYKGYTAHIQFDNEKKCLKGITKIGDYEVAFFGDNMPDLNRKFEALVDQGLLDEDEEGVDKKASTSARIYPISPSVERTINARRMVEMAQPPEPKIESGFGFWQSIRQHIFIEFIGNVIWSVISSCFMI